MRYFLWNPLATGSPGFWGKAGLLAGRLGMTPADLAGAEVSDLLQPIVDGYYTIGSNARSEYRSLRCLSDVVMTVSWTGTLNSPPGRLHVVEVAIPEPLPFLQDERVWITFTMPGQ